MKPEQQRRSATKRTNDPGILLVCSDGTSLLARYTSHWVFELLEEGVRFVRIAHDVKNEYDVRDGLTGGDEAHFHDGLKWVYVAISRWWQKLPDDAEARTRKSP